MTKTELLLMIAKPDMDDDVLFSRVILALLHEFGMTVEEMATTFDVSVSAVYRWSTGMFSPVSTVRKHVYDVIRERLTTHE
jgi:predicted transcriptional regulator